MTRSVTKLTVLNWRREIWCLPSLRLVQINRCKNLVLLAYQLTIQECSLWAPSLIVMILMLKPTRLIKKIRLLESLGVGQRSTSLSTIVQLLPMLESQRCKIPKTHVGRIFLLWFSTRLKCVYAMICSEDWDSFIVNVKCDGPIGEGLWVLKMEKMDCRERLLSDVKSQFFFSPFLSATLISFSESLI